MYQPAASNSPTSWAALGLPAGVTINTSTGRISGAATEAGVYNVNLTAINGDGTSAPLFVAMGIESSIYEPDGSVEINVDWLTGKVTNPATKDGEPVAFLARGDTLIAAVGIMKNAQLQDLPVTLVQLAIKEYEGEAVLSLGDGLFRKSGSFDQTRYKTAIKFEPDALTPILASYEGDRATYFDATAELRIMWSHQLLDGGEVVELERTSQNFTIRLSRDFIVAP
nr:Ig domain-containing protein [Verrucomicrobium sp. BvORR106]